MELKERIRKFEYINETTSEKTGKVSYVFVPDTEYIKKRMKKVGFSNEGLSHKMGITMMSLNNKLAGKTNFTIFEALVLCDILNFTDEEFLKVFLRR